MADPLDIFRQRERPGYFVQPTTPPRDITSLSDAELDSYLRGFSSPPIGNDPTASPYSARDLRLERARRQPATRRNEGFELEDGRNELPLPPIPPPVPPAAAAAPPSNTNAPARTPAASRQPATDLDRLRAAATDPNFSDQGSLYGPLRPAGQQQQPAQSSVLDMLRKRLARDTENEALQRASEFGAGMLASGSPNFFAMLGGGARAAREGDVSRMDQLRRLADLERQQRMTDIEEQRRRDEAQYRENSLRLRREEAARANRPRFTELTDAQGNVVFIDPESGRRVSTDLRPARGQARPLSEADRATLRNRAETLANARVGIMQGVQPTAAQLEQARGLADDLFRVMLESAGATPPAQTGNTQPAPATAPSRTLTYTPPRISSQPQQ